MEAVPFSLASVPASVRRTRAVGMLLGTLWLILFIGPLRDSLGSGTPTGTLTGILLLLFMGLYVASLTAWRLPLVERPRSRGLRWVLVAAVLVATVVTLLGGMKGLVTAPFLAVMSVLILPRGGILAVLACAVAAELVSWRLTGSFSDRRGIATGVLTSGLAVWAVVLLIGRARDQIARAETEAALARAQERARFARDLHDLLGHSLTVITVKAELASRLLTAAPDDARTEMADVERLSREALADIRRAVQGYREISLGTELARARQALQAAGVEARLPSTVEELPQDRQALFAWTVREGVTNVVRHARARHCSIVLTDDAVTIDDDGAGMSDAALAGRGLVGLRERAASLGAVVELGERQPRGCRLRVELPS